MAALTRVQMLKVLQEYNRSVQHMHRLMIRVRAVTSPVVRASEAIRVEAGLMTSDAVTVALVVADHNR